MAISSSALSKALVLTGVLLAGCAGEGTDSLFTTGSLNSTTAAAPEPKVDAMCVSLVSRIDGLRKEGIADKIEKAAVKKYKLTTKDLAKADQLTKASAELQLRCTTITPASAQPTQPATMPAQKTSMRSHEPSVAQAP
jgi:hypothetical protein